MLLGNNLLSRHLGPLQKYGGATWSRTKNVYHEGTDLQSADAHAIASIAPYLVDRRGIEPRLKACKAPVLPLSLPAQNLVANGGLEPPTHALSRRCSTPELTGQKSLVVMTGFEPVTISV